MAGRARGKGPGNNVKGKSLGCKSKRVEDRRGRGRALSYEDIGIVYEPVKSTVPHRTRFPRTQPPPQLPGKSSVAKFFSPFGNSFDVRSTKGESFLGWPRKSMYATELADNTFMYPGIFFGSINFGLS